MSYHSIFRRPAPGPAGLAAKPAFNTAIPAGRICIASLIALLLFTGCTTPLPGHTVISPKVTDSYQLGVTTQSDILSELGLPGRHSPDDLAIAYIWMTSTGQSGQWNFFLWSGTPGYTGLRYHAYCAAFDEHHLLIRSEYLVAEDEASFDRQWEEWQNISTPEQPSAPPELVTVSAPDRGKP